ncbi:MAG TPA: signal peptidase I [Gaiellaceae bacterium]|nr:signal peptidase I [Gaiellaceae bacterium]
MTTRPARAVAGAAAIVLLAAACWLLWPTQLGGRTGYAVIVGTSMEPELSRGDLAVVRERPAYEVGDAVLYRNSDVHRNVLHRIVRDQGDRFLLKGDANDFLDGARPTEQQVVGKLWVVLPGVGTVVEWLQKPLNAAIVALVAFFLLLGGGREASKRRRLPGQPVARSGGSPPRAPSPGAGAHALLAGSLALAAASALLAVVSWTRAAEELRTDDQAYVGAGRFAYAADVHRSPVYPDGRVETGDAVFTSIVRKLAVTFDYRFETELDADVRGTARLDATIDDGAGWSRSFPLVAQRGFVGTETHLRGALDLERLTTVVDQMRALTGSGVSTFTVQVVPTVVVRGRVGSTDVAESFTPPLTFALDPTGLRLDPPDDASDPLTPQQEGTAAAAEAASVGLGPFSLPVPVARFASLVLLGLGLLGAAVAGALAPRRPLGDAERVERRLRARIVPAAGGIPAGRWVADVPDLATLSRIAEAYDRVVLRVGDSGREAYMVDDGVAVYRYRPVAPVDDAPTLVLAARER